MTWIDTHIHLDQYDDHDVRSIMRELPRFGLDTLIAVSMNRESCQRTESLARAYPGIIRPAYGYHPEQPLPSAQQMKLLLDWIEARIDKAIAIGEVGLPYYRRQELATTGNTIYEQGYIDLLEQHLQLAARYDKPVVLHAVYDDADIVCELLEQHRITRAHFHWFKGAAAQVERLARSGYYISFTPDIAYEPEIRQLAAMYPRELVMTETDGPWRFEGQFAGQPTVPGMVRDVCRAWAHIQGLEEADAARQLYNNARKLYRL
ncbi:TatD family hydrolase [Paenibacillus campi]|uniref:TatD family hydrolase n=1 Tax=Paenibacillus campi TaxID=3106031 RepID=UPI002AFFA46B|nr:TatD family hydrolase [Paenibacillus sp. SGZ-1009]